MPMPMLGLRSWLLVEQNVASKGQKEILLPSYASSFGLAHDSAVAGTCSGLGLSLAPELWPSGHAKFGARPGPTPVTAKGAVCQSALTKVNVASVSILTAKTK